MALSLGAAEAARAQQYPEASLSADDFKRLDTFEAQSLQQADKVFAAKDYRRAVAEYDSFLLQFPKSGASAYALLRKARALHLGNKRYEAIRAYNEVMDYFPNAVEYAGAALYYLGLAHEENGDPKEAMKAWAEMAQDVDYRKHVLAAGAVNRLGDNLVKLGKPDEAVAYYEQVAADFRQANQPAAQYAIEQAVAHWIRTRPNEARLRQFYDKVGTWEWPPRKPDDRNYWARVRENIERFGKFTQEQQAEQAKYYAYWAGAMEGKFDDWDDFQIDAINYRRTADGDVNAWLKRLDQQFARTPPTPDRVIKWLALYRGQKAKAEEYYAKLDFGQVTNEQAMRLVRVLYEQTDLPAMAKSAFGHVQLDKLSEDQRYQFERALWHRDEEVIDRICQSFEDKDRGRMELLRYFHWRCAHWRNAFEKAHALADEMTKVAATEKEAWWMKAELLHWQGKFEEAIAAYRRADNPPTNLWRISDCFKELKRKDQAVAQLREIENFFADQAPEAALRIAWLHRDTGDQKQFIAALRGVMNKYPASGQSNTAHEELEKLGLRIGGGIDAE